MTRTKTIATLLAVIAVGGCGTAASSTSNAGPVAEQPRNKQTYTVAQVLDALQLTKDPNDSTVGVPFQWSGLWDAKTECTIAVVMTTQAEVDTYVSAGDPVASNPSRTAGVKYGTYQGHHPSACYRIFTMRLRALS